MTGERAMERGDRSMQGRHSRMDWTGRAKILGCLLITTAALAGLGSACSSSTGVHVPPPPRGGSVAGAGAHAIHVIAVRPDGSRKQYDFGQGTELASSTASRAASATPSGGLHKQDLPGTTPVTPAPTVGSPQGDIAATAWALVQRAAIECDTLGNFLFVDPTPWTVDPTLNKSDWLVYPQLGFSCSQRLYTEQDMLCVADKLAEIGDAVGTVVF